MLSCRIRAIKKVSIKNSKGLHSFRDVRLARVVNISDAAMFKPPCNLHDSAVRRRWPQSATAGDPPKSAVRYDSAMRVAIVGAGAIGSLIGHALCRAGCRVSMIDRSARLADIERLGGVAVVDPDGRATLGVPHLLADRTAVAGQHDAIFLATKAHDLPAAAASLEPLLGPDSYLVTLQNGIPWWYFHGLEHRLAGTRLDLRRSGRGTADPN